MEDLKRLEDEHRELQKRLKVTDMHAWLCYKRTCDNEVTVVKLASKSSFSECFSYQLFERELRDITKTLLRLGILFFFCHLFCLLKNQLWVSNYEAVSPTLLHVRPKGCWYYYREVWFKAKLRTQWSLTR